MVKNKHENDKQVKISVGDISDIVGEVNIAGGNINTTHMTTSITPGEIKQLFDQVYKAIETRINTPAANKEDLKSEVEEVQTYVEEAVTKQKKVDEGFFARRFRNIARMAPDILDIIIASLASPMAGIGLSVKKIAEKAKAETIK